MFNDIFPYVYVINLDKDVTKWEDTFNTLTKNGISTFKRISGVVVNQGKTIKDREDGCKQSHLNIIQKAKDLNLKYVCIFEDDVEFKFGYEFYLPLIKMFIMNQAWDMLYLGCNYRQGPEDSGFPNISRLKGAYTTHAYIVHSEVYDLILKSASDDPIDVIYSKIIQPNNKCFCCNPRLVSQKSGFSGIQNRIVDYRCLRD